MVKEIQANETTLFQCEECQLKYRDKETAEKCQVWCKEHNSCNLEIIKNAVQEENNQ